MRSTKASTNERSLPGRKVIRSSLSYAKEASFSTKQGRFSMKFRTLIWSRMDGLFIATSCWAWRSSCPRKFGHKPQAPCMEQNNASTINYTYRTVRLFLRFCARAPREIRLERAFAIHPPLGIAGLGSPPRRLLRHACPCRADRPLTPAVRLDGGEEVENECSRIVGRA